MRVVRTGRKHRRESDDEEEPPRLSVGRVCDTRDGRRFSDDC